MLFSHSLFASLGTLVDVKDIPPSVCAAKITTHSENYYCSGALVGLKYFKTAAHCLKDVLNITVKCASGESRKVVNILSHKLFSFKNIKRDLTARKYDQAILELDFEFSNMPIQPVLNLQSDIKQFILTKRECAFFGVGLNPWYKGTGLLHGAKTNSTKLLLEDGLIVIDDPFGAVSMIGDSGGSFFCKDDNDVWTNIGTVSAHSWENETIISSNSNLVSDQQLKSVNLDHGEEFHSILLKRVMAPVIDVGHVYFVLPFSKYFVDEEQFNIADRQRSRFTVDQIEGDFAIGTLDHYGPANYYLCGEGVSCEEVLIQVKIKKDRLITSRFYPKFLNLR